MSKKSIKTKKELTDLQIMNIMAERNMDIKHSTSFAGGKTIKGGGGKIEMFVDEASVLEVNKGAVLGNPKYLTVLYLINKDQFFKIQDEPLEQN